MSCCAVMKHQKKYCQMLLARYFRNKKKASKNEEKVKEEPFRSMVASYGLIFLSESVDWVTKYEEAVLIGKDFEKIDRKTSAEYNLRSLQTELPV